MPGGGSQPSGNTTSVQKADPWTGAQPYMKQALAGAQNLYENNTPGYYPNSTNAPMNPWQGNSLQGLYNRGMGGSGVDAAAQGQITDTLGGDYLSGNPHMAQMSNQLAQNITPQVMSQFESSGRYGSGAAANALASSLTNANSKMMYDNYNSERGRMMQAAGLSPEISGTDFRNLTAANVAGGGLQSQQQQALAADKARYDYYQGQPQQSLQNYANIALQPTAGGTKSESTPYFTNPTANAMSMVTGLGGLAASILPLFGVSDRRAKDHIKKIGQADNGLPIYSYRYKGSPTTLLGFMADEVKAANPGAVGTLGGLLTVDYDKAVT